MENNRLNGTISSTETVDRYVNMTKDYRPNNRFFKLSMQHIICSI